ncbi:alpha-aminoadipic semialdehyde synthase [Entomortierella parvispora]|uniref:Alpha-aminoadipic semialdehyde synthase n=1 Tax=Entomortierella parvispora TaxID=205924 RepID=A0A9P3H4R7_9FUNG|nr:alpha-aminoadipic semialdehyde synthase [Entomortierella parvispora]
MSSQASLATKAMPRLGAGRHHLVSPMKRAINRRALSSTSAASGKTYFPQSTPKIQSAPRLTTLQQQQQYQKHTSSSFNPFKSVAIRREGKNRWERRAALTPEAVEKLIKETGIDVYVQPSTKRIFSDDKYRAAGAIVQEDLSPADIILGIKEVPVKDLIPGKTYVYFSHTHKGQAYNMPMLQDVLDKKIRLIDYELMANEQKQRLVLFGKHAGYAGMIDGVHGLGQRLLGLGYSSPFLHVGMAHNYKTLASAKLALQTLGNTISDEGTPKEFGPMTFTFTGGGNVSKGAQAVFKSLPHEFVDPKDLPKIATSKNARLDRIYAAEVNIEDHIRHKSKNVFTSAEEYFAHPEEFTSTFHKDIAPYSSMVINGAYWDNRFPRLMTTEQLKTIQSDPANKFRMLSIADISCDINGSFEFMSHATRIEDPFFYVDAVSGSEHKNTEAPGVQIMSVDILPSELPMESSQHFSDSLYPFIKELIRDNKDHPVLAGATIAENGALKPAHQDLSKTLEATNAKANLAKLKATLATATGSSPNTSFGTNTKPKKVLLCGSGFVAGPLVDYLLRDPNVSLTIASNSQTEATSLALGRANTKVVPLDVKDNDKMASLVKESDIVVSFVPAPFHPVIAEHCINEKKNMVTASYISPAMKALDERAQKAGITIMNEIGLDPGIDHLSAMKMIDEVKAEGGKVTSFVSWCGGLPAPEASNVPLSYKFSWSPRGVLTAGLNDAKFRMHNGFHEIPGKDLMKKHFPDVPIYPGFNLEGVANRDSLSYAETYGLGPVEKLDTMFRGTLRYKGYADLMYSFNRLGLLNAETSQQGFNTWTDFMDNLLFGNGSAHDNQSRTAAIADRLDLPKNHPSVGKVVDALQWLSLMPTVNNQGNAPFTAKNSTTTLDSFCNLLMHKLKYNPMERDMVILHHEFGVQLKDGTDQTRTSTLVSYGTFETYTAMAKTVGLPAAMATEMLLKGEIPEKGVLAPTMPHVYNTILDKLNREGVSVVEQIVQKGMRPMLKWGGSGVFK